MTPTHENHNPHCGHPLSAIPIRIQRKRTKGWRMPLNTIYVGRPTVFGNPYTGKLAIAMYRAMIRGRWKTLERLLRKSFPAANESEIVVAVCAGQAHRQRIIRNIHKFRVANHLACWCPLDKKCHVDVLIEMLNRSKP